MGLNAKIRKSDKQREVKHTADGRRVIASARARYVRCAPRKLALVAKDLRGITVAAARQYLDSIHKPSAAPHLRTLLASAAANAENSAPEPEELVIGELRVEGAPIIKRFRPATYGRMVKIRKRMSHVSIYLTEA